MGICKKGTYRDNIVVKHGPILCYGGLGQAACEHLIECAEENGMQPHKRTIKTGRNGHYR